MTQADRFSEEEVRWALGLLLWVPFPPSAPI